MAVDNLKILYGPDTYMGDNLVTLFTKNLDAGWDDAIIASSNFHPEHNQATLQRLRDN
jgi:hypothetical protein